MRTFELHGGHTYSYLDESDLADCRCGGRAEFKGAQNGGGRYYVRCDECGIQTAKRTSEQSVMLDWNKVMGGLLL